MSDVRICPRCALAVLAGFLALGTFPGSADADHHRHHGRHHHGALDADALADMSRKLREAVRNNNLAEVQPLVWKADHNAQNKDGKTALDVAQNDEIKGVLKKAGARAGIR